MALVGIDLGTTNSLIAVWKDGKVELIPNALGSFLTPSVVGVDDVGQLLVGETARHRRVTHPDSTVAEFKRKMGTDETYLLGHRRYLPEELSAILLRRLLADAENYLGEKVTEAVISVPAYFDNNQREATRQAARMAGVELKRLVNEPSAAVLYKQWKRGNSQVEGTHMVVDFGGGTLDVSVVDCFENIIEIISVAGNNQLGGKDFDAKIAEDFCEKNGLQYDKLKKSAKENLLWTAEYVKKALTEKDSVSMHAVMDDQSYETEYHRDELIQITASLLVQIKEVIEEALNGAHLDKEDITDVILVGGSCKMPMVQKYISSIFNREITVDEEGDYLVGYGAGALTGIIRRESQISDIIMTDVCPFSLGTSGYRSEGAVGDYMQVIIPKNSILPISKTLVWSSNVQNYKKMHFRLFQGEEQYVGGNLYLGELEIDVVPDMNGVARVETTFFYDINGVLEVHAKDLRSGIVTKKVFLSKSRGLSAAELEQRSMTVLQESRYEKNKEENKRVLAWAKRLYTQATPGLKVLLMHVITDFQQVLESNDLIKVRKKREVLLNRLPQLEQMICKDYFGEEDVFEQLKKEMK